MFELVGGPKVSVLDRPLTALNEVTRDVPQEPDGSTGVARGIVERRVIRLER